MTIGQSNWLAKPIAACDSSAIDWPAFCELTRHI